MPHRPESISTIVNQWATERPTLDLGTLAMFVAVAHVYWLTSPHIEQLMAEHGITRGMFDVLANLRRAGKAQARSPRQISRSLLLSGAGLTGRLDRLEADGLIVRLPDLDDGRGLKISLTAKGLRLIDRILPKLIQLETRLAEGLSKREANELTELLTRLADSVHDYAEASGAPGTDREAAPARTSRSSKTAS